MLGLSVIGFPPLQVSAGITQTGESPSTTSGLSLHDRIAQLIIVRGYGDYPPQSDPEYRRFLHWIQEDHVGGFIVAGHIRNGSVIRAQPFEMVAFINHLQAIAKTPLLVGSDFERGASMRVAGTADFPYLMAFGAAHNLAYVKALGAATAREARDLGVNWVFAPDADVNNNPSNPIINTRSFGEDPAAVAAGVQAFIEGAHSTIGRYVLVTAKHFPGHGDTSEDSHLRVPKVNVSRDRLNSVELVPFRAAIKSGVDSIMTGHLAVPAIESDGRPATVSRKILTGLLQDELGFKGLVVTDALEMRGITSRYSSGEAAVLAVEAGADVLLMPPDPAACIKALMGAVASGRISRERIDRSVTKVLAAKLRVGLMAKRTVDVDRLSDELSGTGGDALAQTAADHAITLVKDEKHLFPIGNSRNACLVVLGESLFTQRGEALSLELRRSLKNLKVYVVTPSVPGKLLSAVVEDTKECSRIYAAAFVTVAASRGSVALEGGLNKFLDGLIHGPVPVALVSFGNPYLLRNFKDVPAYAATFSTTQTSEIAAARAILGKIPIGGRMPVSIPGIAKVGDGIDVAARASTASK